MPARSGPVTWEDFTARLKAVYWPGLAPEARQLSRPVPEGTGAQVVPDDVWQAIVTVFPDPEAWLGNPVPQLGGQTPLQALAKGKVQEVRGLVMGVADFFLPDPDEVVPWEEYEAAQREAEPGGER